MNPTEQEIQKALKFISRRFRSRSMKSATIRITPAIAAAMLRLNCECNRLKRMFHVKRLVSELVKGNYVPTGESISISKTLKLLNGQHRMLAVVESGVSVMMVVAYGICDSAFPYYDSGLSRKPADVLQAMTIKGKKITSTTTVSAVLRNIWKYERKILGLSYGDKFVSSEVQRTMNKHPEVLTSVKAWINKTPLVPCSVVCTMDYLLSQVSEDGAAQFICDVLFETKLKSGSPELALQKFFLANPRSKSRRSEGLIAMFIKAWNAKQAGKSVREFTVVDAVNTKWERIAR